MGANAVEKLERDARIDRGNKALEEIFAE